MNYEKFQSLRARARKLGLSPNLTGKALAKAVYTAEAKSHSAARLGDFLSREAREKLGYALVA